MPTLLSELSRSGSEGYQSAINSAVRGLWSGALDRAAFTSSMRATVSRWLAIAWREGMKACDVNPDEITDEQAQVINDIVKREFTFISGFGADIAAGNKASGGLVRPFLNRAAQWANRYNEVKFIAQILACADKRYRWVMDPKKKHCKDCTKLHGKVRTGAGWIKYGVAPGSYKLACKGNCGCELKRTNLPVTPGSLPRVSGAK